MISTEEKILEKIKMEQEISPFLFVWQNMELVNQKAENIALELLKKLDIPKVNIFKLEDNWEKIKIAEIKQFLEKSNSTSPYRIQIFIIENFSRVTINAANSCLKIFEEPGIQNIFLLTNNSENNILETILSRVNVVDLWTKKVENSNDFFIDLIENTIKNKKNSNLIKYFFQKKLEKDEYISFLKSLVNYFAKNYIFINELEDLQDDINMISSNNVIAKNVVDKWILKIIN